jgi:hypothetical protein
VTDSAEFAALQADDEDLGDLLLEVLPGDGSTMGNQSAREALSRAAERQISEEGYKAQRDTSLQHKLSSQTCLLCKSTRYDLLY